jgi:hypothetical protein
MMHGQKNIKSLSYVLSYTAIQNNRLIYIIVLKYLLRSLRLLYCCSLLYGYWLTYLLLFTVFLEQLEFPILILIIFRLQNATDHGALTQLFSTFKTQGMENTFSSTSANSC